MRDYLFLIKIITVLCLILFTMGTGLLFIAFLLLCYQIYSVFKYLNPPKNYPTPNHYTQKDEVRKSASSVDKAKEFPKSLEKDRSDYITLFFSEIRVVGVSFTNTNGTNRQDILSRLREGAKLSLVHIPDEKYPNRVSVQSEFGCVGNLPDEFAKMILNIGVSEGEGHVASIGKNSKGLIGLYIYLRAYIKNRVVSGEMLNGYDSKTDQFSSFKPSLLYYFLKDFQRIYKPEHRIILLHKNKGVMLLEGLSNKASMPNMSYNSNSEPYLNVNILSEGRTAKFTCDVLKTDIVKEVLIRKSESSEYIAFFNKKDCSVDDFNNSTLSNNGLLLTGLASSAFLVNALTNDREQFHSSNNDFRYEADDHNDNYYWESDEDSREMRDEWDKYNDLENDHSIDYSESEWD